MVRKEREKTKRRKIEDEGGNSGIGRSGETQKREKGDSTDVYQNHALSNNFFTFVFLTIENINNLMSEYLKY